MRLKGLLGIGKSLGSFSLRGHYKNILVKIFIYLYPHDEILQQLEHKIADKTYLRTRHWSTPKLTKENAFLLEQYKLN